jgi:alpha-L-rhamnosidase
MNPDLATKVVYVTTQYPVGLIGLPGNEIELSWKVESTIVGARQLGYRVQRSEFADFASVDADTGWLAGGLQIGVVAPGGDLASRAIRYFRVAIQTERGFTNWSASISYEVGLLRADDWTAVAIGDGSPKESPSPLLRHAIHLAAAPIKARLYVTSMGINQFLINGVRTSQSELNPGWTAYEKRLLIETHDVTMHLKQGPNVLAGVLSDGWWRGKLGFFNGYEHYGKELGLLAQLEIECPDGTTQTFKTDGTWKTSTGAVRFSSIYDGCLIDYNQSPGDWHNPGFDDSHWINVTEVNLDFASLKPRITNPVMRIRQLPMTVEKLTDRTLLRGSQNISGWVRLTIDGKKGQTVSLRHAEVLEPGDVLHTEALRTAKAVDTYVLAADGIQVLEPEFTFHGFQYADVVTDAAVLNAEAIAISSVSTPRSSFKTSDRRLNKLHENVVWSQLDNFVSVPTDCPQRDERLGWTGDAQAFANTANTLFDSSSFWSSWLQDLELDQLPSGDVPAVVPDILKHYPQDDGWIFEGRAGWGDAATIVPFSVYESYGNLQVLRDQLGSMRLWTDALDKRRKGAALLPQEFQFGDWCDPDAPADKPWLSKVNPDFVANSFFAHTAALMARAEELVGDKERGAHYRDLAQELRDNIWVAFGAEVPSTPAGCALALCLEIAPPNERQPLAKHLAKLVHETGGMISTGFLSTPYILHALSKNGQWDAAFKMLMRCEFRSWLYAIDKGATTIWERWDAITEDGSIHTGTDSDSSSDGGSMISFNHYAYGAVVDWIYRNLGGLEPAEGGEGYRLIRVAPRPAEGLTFANTSIETPYGKVSLDWSLFNQDLLIADLTVPFGSEGILDFAGTPASELRVNGKLVGNGSALGHGKYRIELSKPAIVDYT